MSATSPIGSLMGYAEQQAALQRFSMDKTYRARLAREIKLELRRGTHHDDVKTAIRLLIERRLSPGLLRRKVEDIRGTGLKANLVIEDDPLPDFPEQTIDPSWLQED